MTTVPKAIDYDVWNTAIANISDGLIDACTSLRNALIDDEDSRGLALPTAQADFAGFFADLFASNQKTRNGDGQRLVSALDAIIAGVQGAQTAAKDEQARIDRARQWQREHDEWEAGRDSAWYGETLYLWFNTEPAIDAGDLNPKPAPQIQFPASVTAGNRQTPSIGSKVGETTISAARPDALDAYVVTSNSLCDALDAPLNRLKQAYDSFETGWKFKDGAQAIHGMNDFIAVCRAFNTANRDENQWLTTISNAFKQAGGSSEVVSLSDQALLYSLSLAGLDASGRGVLQIPSVRLAGMNPSTGYADDPVNTVTGNFIEPELDLRLEGASNALYFGRMYNSFTAVKQLNESGECVQGVCGIGWESMLDQRLEISAELLSWVKEDGRHVQFLLEDGLWDRQVALKADRDIFWIQTAADFPYFKESSFFNDFFKVAATDFVIADNEGSCWLFDETGKWKGLWGGPGRGVRVWRGSETGLVDVLEHENGETLNCTYDNGKLTKISASDGSFVEFSYRDNHLVEARTLNGTRTYTHTSEGLIRQVISAAGVSECINTYDEKGRVLSQISAHGRESRYVYLPGNVTLVSDVDGGRANTWIADVYGRTVGIIDTDGQRVSRSYDSNNNLVSVTDRLGKQTFNFFDKRGHIVRTVLPTRAELHYEWDKFDRVVSTRGENGVLVCYVYEPQAHKRNPIEIHDGLGGVTKLTWDGAKLLRLVDPAGVGLSFTYDMRGDLIGIENAQGSKVIYTRDEVGRLIATTTPAGNTYSLTYDQFGRVGELKDPAGAVWKYAYDQAGRPLSVTDPYGAVSSVAYGSDGELFCETDELGNSTTYSHDDLGNLKELRLPDETMWRFSHDGLSRLKEVTDPSGATWRYGFDVNGVLNRFSDPTGITSLVSGDITDGKIQAITGAQSIGELEFDGYGRIVKTVSEAGDATSVTYDALGNITSLVNAQGGITKLVRDVAGRIVCETDPAGGVTTYTYDACGRVETVTRSGKGTETYFYNADSKVSCVRSASGEETTFDYDSCGRMVSGYIPGHGRFERDYDLCGRLIYSRDLINGIRRFKYNQAGQLVKAINGVGGATSYAYDTLGRLVQITAPDGSLATREYDASGNLVASTDWYGNRTEASYDEAGRLISQTGAEGISLEYTYDAQGEIESISANGKLLSRFERDQALRVIRLSDYTDGFSPIETTHTLVWDSLGRLRFQESAAGHFHQTQQWKYDQVGNRTGFAVDGQKTDYHYNQDGLLTSVNHPLLGVVEFRYDQAGRVVEAIQGENVSSWTYENGFIRSASNGTTDAGIERDAWGRVTRITRGSEQVTYAYDDANQLVEACDGNLCVRWEYDTLGQVVRKTAIQEDDVVWAQEFTYAGPGQVNEVRTLEAAHKGQGGLELTGTVAFKYDAAGNRSEETIFEYVSGAPNLVGVVSYDWDARGLLRSIEHAGDGQTRVLRVHVDGLGQVVKVGERELTWDRANMFPQLVHVSDGFETSAGVHTAGGSGPFQRWFSMDLLDPYANSGATVTVEGLQWLGARLYDPYTQGFLSVDPWPYPDAGSVWEVNTYSYAANNPLALVDPSGLKPITDMSVIEAYNANRSQSFLDKYGAYVFAGGMIVIGIAVMATGVGGPLGAAMISGAFISGGISMGSSKYSDGAVDWGAFYRDTLIGGAFGLLGGSASTGVKSLIFSRSASAQTALKQYGGKSIVQKAGTGWWSWVKGNTKVVNAVNFGLDKGDDLRHLTVLDDFLSPLAGNVVEANSQYALDVWNGERSLSVRDFTIANVGAVFDVPVAGFARAWRGQALSPIELSVEATRDQRINRFIFDFGVDTTAGAMVNVAESQVVSHVYGDEGATDSTRNVYGDMAKNFGDNLHNAVPELDRNHWMPHLKKIIAGG